MEGRTKGVIYLFQYRVNLKFSSSLLMLYNHISVSGFPFLSRRLTWCVDPFRLLREKDI